MDAKGTNIHKDLGEETLFVVSQTFKPLCDPTRNWNSLLII